MDEDDAEYMQEDEVWCAQIRARTEPKLILYGRTTILTTQTTGKMPMSLEVQMWRTNIIRLNVCAALFF